MIHPDGYKDGTCVGCGHRPIWHVEAAPPLCVRGVVVEREPTAEDIQRVYDAIEPFLGPWDPGGFQCAEAAIKAFLRIAP